MMQNNGVRKAARVAGIPLWKIAEHIGISEPTLTRWLRKPLTPEKEEVIIEAIQKLEQEVS